MKIAISGASGQVAKLLIPLLQAEHCELLLVGRNPEQLNALYPDASVCGYKNLSSHIQDFDVFLHLAVLNNNAGAKANDFQNANVNLALEVANTAKDARVKSFIFVSSTHALDHKNTGLYAESKRQAAKALKSLNWPALQILYLPAVYGQTFIGNLNALNRLPKAISKPLFIALSALKPTVSIAKVADQILKREHQADQELIISDRQKNNLAFQFFKRSIDIVFAVFIIVFFWWVLLLVFAAIKIESKGGGIFAQERVGKGGKVFTCYKFRTMNQGTPQAGTHEISASAVTGIGQFLRRTKIDELPQVWNILRNEISLVGPRPCLPSQTQLVELRQQKGVLDVKPGITGLAQINGIDMSVPILLAIEDEKYIQLQSLILDVKIIIGTLLGKGSQDRVKV